MSLPMSTETVAQDEKGRKKTPSATCGTPMTKQRGHRPSQIGCRLGGRSSPLISSPVEGAGGLVHRAVRAGAQSRSTTAWCRPTRKKPFVFQVMSSSWLVRVPLGSVMRSRSPLGMATM